MKKLSYGSLRAIEGALRSCPVCACGRLTHLLVKEKLRFYAGKDKRAKKGGSKR